MNQEQNELNGYGVEDTIPPKTSLKQAKTDQGLNNVVAVFVVQFDVHKGNLVEWQYPEAAFDLDGVEYQAICSGLHRIESDVIYFSRNDVYGISAFQNMPTETERGAHMKAIGIIVQPTLNTGICGQVWTHKKFLKKELSHHMVLSESIESSRYERLLEYYTHHQYREEQQEEREQSPNFYFPESNNHHSVNYNLKHNVAKGMFSHDEFGAVSFSHFVHRFGPDIFVLWKAALLRKRIMLINMPPMETACEYVYNIHLLGKVPTQFQNRRSDLVPKFTVGVNDIPQLEKKNQSYVACTPDSIFQIKTELYDLLITLPTPSFHHPIKGSSNSSQAIPLSEISSNQPRFKSSVMSTTHNPADFTRFRIMWKQLMSSSSTSWAEYVAAEPKDIVNTAAALVTGVYYWLYQEPHESSPSRFYSSWQNLFAGNTRRDSNNQLPIFLNQTSTADESQNLLLDEDEEDATEINNSEVFSVVAARASSEMYQSQEIDVLVKEDNEILLG
ncbi:hypothetical protein INT47_009668 [Mucor saturninus]|uniref:Uncharacterized protein n=1 Tax=Mucor saturninus TaxID=64648 RepID=A0A8H7UW42_9FUNG|nr:hypothetical protein INT47_009668 [Mucor saturninus]